MRRFLGLAGLVFLLALPVQAQQVRVTSGEHPDFSRIVFQTRGAEPWSLGRGDGGYLLRFENTGLSFDFARVFDLIPRTRIRAVESVEPGVVAFDVAEDAYGEAYILRPGVLVLDFYTGTPPAESPFESMAGPGLAERQDAAAPASATPASVAVSSTEPAASAPPPVLPGLIPLASDARKPSPIIGPLLTPQEQAAVSDPRVAELRSSLMQQIGRAATQGLLEPAIDAEAEHLAGGDGQGTAEIRGADEHAADDHTAAGHGADGAGHAAPMHAPATTGQATQPQDTAHAGEPQPPSGAEGHGTGQGTGHGVAQPQERRTSPHVQIQTSIDQALGLNLGHSTAVTTARGYSCLPDRFFDVMSWGAERPAAELIAERRSALIDARDRVDPNAVRDLVQAYLAMTMGVEARAVLREIGLDHPAVPVWRDMAFIMDEGQGRRPDLFARQLACPSRVALWAALSLPELPPGEDIDEVAIVRAFAELPLHLRRHLAPMITARFVAAGDESTALKLRNAVARLGPAAESHDLALVDARLALVQGHDEEATAQIDAVLDEGGLSTADALAMRLETQLDGAEVPTMEDVELAEALAFERRGSDPGTALLVLSVRGHAANAAFEKAFDMLVAEDLDGDAGLVSELLVALAEDGSDADILRESFSGFLSRPGLQADAEARLAVADRLARLGFPDRAQALLADVAPRGTPKERMVLARLALAREMPGQALQFLSGVEGTEADLLRARAAQQQADPAAAARYYRSAGDTEREAALAWRAQDWDTVEAAGPAPQRDFATMRRDAPVPEPEGEQSLSGARALLDGSEAMRRQLDQLLGTVPATN